MKSIYNSANERFRSIQQATHGGNIWDYPKSASQIIDFSSNVNPFGISHKVIDAIKKNLWKIAFYPDTKYLLLRRTIAEYLDVKKENVVV